MHPRRSFFAWRDCSALLRGRTERRRQHKAPLNRKSISVGMAALGALLVTSPLQGASDPELSNMKSGISLVWGVGDGSDKGEAYMEEYLYHDKTISDRKIVYIRDTTPITMRHNEFNNVAVHATKGPDDTSGPFGFFRVIGADGLDGVPNSGDEGVIRYRIDREGQTGKFAWTAQSQTIPVHPAYIKPVSFKELTYSEGVPVVGSTGMADGYQRGILDDFGDEWHVIAVGDDDMLNDPAPRAEQQASDGKIHTFVVNPKTPGLTVRATGDAQFYTTPPKAYLVAKVHPQTTYLQTGSGKVTFELRDIYGRKISYRINGGQWVEAGSNSVTIPDTAFTDGKNTLEYRSAGLETHAKTRTVVKNPPHPCLKEPHGNFLWGDAEELAKIKARLDRDPYLAGWKKLQSPDSLMLDQWDANGMTGHRNPFFSATHLNRVPLPTPCRDTAFIGLVNGYDTVPEGRTKSWGQYAKEQLLNGILTRIDPVDSERVQSNGANPSTEILGAGYYQVGHTFGTLIAYDLLAGNFRSDQNPAGLTPIEDYFIRDILASTVSDTSYGILVGGAGNEIGLWGGARTVGSVMIAQCLKEYSTPYYGTSGFGVEQTEYPWTPHPTFHPTWKTIYATTPDQSPTVPGTTVPAWTIEDPKLWQPGGIWGGPNLGYFNLMNTSMQILLNINARHSPNTVYPILNLGIKNAINGKLTTIANQPPVYSPQPLVGNAPMKDLGRLAVAAIKANNQESQVIRENGLLGLIWYDDTLDGAPTTAPSAEQAKASSSHP